MGKSFLSPKQQPHHASNHMELNWKDFISRPWTMERVGRDLDVMNDRTERTLDTVVCQEKFQFRDVVSCHQKPYPSDHRFRNKTRTGHRFSEHQPFYEMRNDGSGVPYANLLEMRAAKIRNMLNTSNYRGVRKLDIVRYEDLVARGTGGIIGRLEALTEIRARCATVPSQNRVRRKGVMDLETVQYVTEHIDWHAERLIGYNHSIYF